MHGKWEGKKSPQLDRTPSIASPLGSLPIQKFLSTLILHLVPLPAANQFKKQVCWPGSLLGPDGGLGRKIPDQNKPCSSLKPCLHHQGLIFCSQIQHATVLGVRREWSHVWQALFGEWSQELCLRRRNCPHKGEQKISGKSKWPQDEFLWSS
jgi:hypothetical protein